MNKRNKILFVIILVFSFAMAFVILFLINNNNDRQSYYDLPDDLNLVSEKDITSYPLTENESMNSLKQFINLYIQDERFSIYIEDYSTGEWAAINPDIKLNPASLLKVPTLVAVLKKVEKRELSLGDTTKLNSLDLDMGSGALGIKGEGHVVTVKGLIVDLIVNSDNTALYTLNRRILDDDDLSNARKGLGLVFTDVNTEYIGPRDFSNIFRSLYFSTYLDKKYSNIALNLLSRTAFRSQVPAGVPYDVVVAHKVGFRMQGGYYHDCGIVYLPEKPYFICVMSSNVTKKEADSTISEISNVVYSYMSTASS